VEKFSVYPANLQGVALLCLRVSLACMPLASSRVGLISSLPDIAFLIAGGALLVGALVRVVALCAFALATTELLSFSAANFVLWLVAAAIGILGPGAYSVDARLFGRRAIHVALPRRRQPQDSDG
jgi:hypothetical protein